MSRAGAAIWLAVVVACAHAQTLEVRNNAGLRVMVDRENTDPALLLFVPDGTPNQAAATILFPEHVTVRPRSQTDAKHLYLFRPGRAEVQPSWRKIGNSLEYERDFEGIHFAARATLQENGILFRYSFDNRSAINYAMATAITDPRFHTIFYDPRLERTYVHQGGAFNLLAVDSPERLTESLQNWFPVRYLASYTAPVPAERVQHREDGITYRYSSQPVDVPMIATLSLDRAWVANSFARSPGNVWTNPELTCQHVDPDVPLAAGTHAEYEVKILLFKGTLDDALRMVVAQRGSLK